MGVPVYFCLGLFVQFGHKTHQIEVASAIWILFQKEIPLGGVVITHILNL